MGNVGIICGILSIPWIIVFYMFMSGGQDPETCFVKPGELWTAPDATGLDGAYDIAAEYRSWFTRAFFVYICLCVFQLLYGVFFLLGESTLKLG